MPLSQYGPHRPAALPVFHPLCLKTQCSRPNAVPLSLPVCLQPVMPFPASASLWPWSHHRVWFRAPIRGGISDGRSERGLCLCAHLARGNYDDKEVTCRKKSPPGRLSIPQHIIQLLQPDAHPSCPPAYSISAPPPCGTSARCQPPSHCSSPKTLLPLEIPTADKLVYSCEWE